MINKTIIALGNPGEEYRQTRHNAGFIVLDKIADIFEAKSWQKDKKRLVSLNNVTINDQIVTLIKPDTFMNLSGMAIQTWQKYDKIKDIAAHIIVIYDDLDLPFGTMKMTNHSPHGHKGIISLKKALRIDEFQQLRLGIDDRQGERKILASDYVLQNFSATQLNQLENEITPLVIEKIKQWL